MENVELKPCPFCGAPAAAPYHNGEYTSCTAKYPTKCPMYNHGKAIPISAWQHRAGDTPAIEPGWMVERRKQGALIKAHGIHEFNRGPMHDSWGWKGCKYYYSTPEDALEAKLKEEISAPATDTDKGGEADE